MPWSSANGIPEPNTSVRRAGRPPPPPAPPSLGLSGWCLDLFRWCLCSPILKKRFRFTLELSRSLGFRKLSSWSFLAPPKMLDRLLGTGSGGGTVVVGVLARGVCGKFSVPGSPPGTETLAGAELANPIDGSRLPNRNCASDPTGGSTCGGGLFPRDASPRDASPRDASPRDASPRDASPRDASPRDASPRDASPTVSDGVYGVGVPGAVLTGVPARLCSLEGGCESPLGPTEKTGGWRGWLETASERRDCDADVAVVFAVVLRSPSPEGDF